MTRQNNPANDSRDGKRPWLPRVWLVRSWRAGENTQLEGLAGALEQTYGWTFEEKRLNYLRAGAAANLLRQVSVGGIDLGSSDALSPPWPDLIISAGLANEPVCRWIREQSCWHSKLVFLGRTWVPSDVIDLTITTPQYRVPPHPNVLQNELTLHPYTTATRRQVVDPDLTVVLLGGNSGPYAYGAAAARRLAGLLDKLDGELAISGSSRTPRDFIEELRNALGRPAEIYAWSADDDDNPYAAWLAKGARFCVTADSIAMLSEAVATGRPVALFDPLASGQIPEEDATLASRTYPVLMRFPYKRLSRDVSLVHSPLIQSDRVRHLEEVVEHGWPHNDDPGDANLQRAIERVTELMRGAVTIQLFDSADWRRFKKLRIAALTESPDAFGPTAEQAIRQDDEFWQNALASMSERGLQLLYARANLRGEQDLGLVSASLDEFGVGYIGAMWVAPAARGIGLGRGLLEAAMRSLRTRNATVVELSVTEGNDTAIGLYRDYGFEMTGNFEPLREGSDKKNLLMRMVLQDN